VFVDWVTIWVCETTFVWWQRPTNMRWGNSAMTAVHVTPTIYTKCTLCHRHTTYNCVVYNASGARAISSALWPPHSSDLNPWNFYLCAVLKNKSTVTNPALKTNWMQAFRIQFLQFHLKNLYIQSMCLSWVMHVCNLKGIICITFFKYSK
jgi:hypothetical protein